MQVNFAAQPGYPGGYPVPISTVYFVNRLDCCNTRITAGNGWVALVSPNGTQYARQFFTQAAWPVVGGSVATFRFNDYQTAPIFPNNSLSTAGAAFQSSIANQNTFVRYIKIVSAPQTCLTFRELFVFDNTVTNVALYKPTSASLASYVSTTAPTSGTLSLPSYGVDGIIEMDNATGGNMVNLPCDGSGWWQVDLGGVYNVTQLIFWNFFPWTSPTTLGAQFGANAANAQVFFANGFGNPVGSVTLNGNMVQTIPVVLTPPTPSITGTPSNTDSPSTTASPSVTPAGTSKQTSSASASVSIGGSPSSTPSPSLTPTTTPSYTPTATVTPSVAPSTLSTLPSVAVLATTGGTWGCLQFAELMIFSPTMELLTAPQRGAVSSSSSTYQSLYFQYGPQTGNDMIVDYSSTETSLFHAACSPTGDTWTVQFSKPSPVAFVYFFNRYTVNGANNVAITNGSGTLSIYGQAGNSVSYVSLKSATVTTIASAIYGGSGVAPSFGYTNPVSVPVLPAANDRWQATSGAQSLAVRYITITNVAGQPMNFRE